MGRGPSASRPIGVPPSSEDAPHDRRSRRPLLRLASIHKPPSVIIGILTAIAFPLFLNQRKKAEDAAAKADVSMVSKEVATGTSTVSACRWSRALQASGS